MARNKHARWDDYEYDDDEYEEEVEAEERSSALIISSSMSSGGSKREELNRPRRNGRKRQKGLQANHRCLKKKQSRENSSILIMTLPEELENEICDILHRVLPSTDSVVMWNGLRKLSDLCEEEKACAKFILDNDGIGLMRHIMAAAMNKLSSFENISDDDANSRESSNNASHHLGDIAYQKDLLVDILAAGMDVLLHLIQDDDGRGGGGGGSGWEEEACLKMHRLGALDLVLQAMTKFVHNCNMQLVGCSFLSEYAACSQKCAKIVVHHHHGNNNNNNNNNCAVIPAILQAMKRHPNHKQLQTCAIRALSAICCTKATATTPRGGDDGGGGVASVYKAGGFSALVRTVETIQLDEETTLLAKKTVAQLSSYLQKNDTFARSV